MCASLYVAAPFLPLEAKEKNVNEGYIGIMLASFAIASIFVGPFIGNILIKFGK